MRYGRIVHLPQPGSRLPRVASAQPSPSQPSLPPFSFRPGRTPRFFSPYGPELHGAARGPRLSFAEPLNAWLSLLGDAVPFYRDALVICPSWMDDHSVRTVLRRARAHIPTAHIAVMAEPRSGALLAGSSVKNESKFIDWRYDCDGALRCARGPFLSMGNPRAAVSLSGAVSVDDDGDGNDAARSSPSPNHALSSAQADVVQATAAPAPAPASTTTTLSTQRSSSFPYSPLATMPAASLDVIIFAANVFGEELLFDSPWHISLAHRVLRPHGVLGIFGYDPIVSVAAPAWAATDLEDALEDHREDASRTLVALRAPVKKMETRGAATTTTTTTTTTATMGEATPSALTGKRVNAALVPVAQPAKESEGIDSSPRNETRGQREETCSLEYRAQLASRLERALEIVCSESVAHADTYMPFPAVQRRWFVSEYAATPEDVAACVRALPSYRVLQERERPGAAATATSVEVTDGTEGADGDFIDTSPEGAYRVLAHDRHDDEGDTSTATPLNVRRRTHTVDPLDALVGCWSARLALEEGYSARNQRDWWAPPRHQRKHPSSSLSSRQPPLRLQVRHFVITCSHRSMNAGMAMPPVGQGLGTGGRRLRLQ